MKCVLTVEASAVMIIVLSILLGLILFDFRLHDKLAAGNALICSVEMYSHRNKEAATAEDYRTIARAENIYITGDGQQVELTTGLLEGSITASVSFGDETRTISNEHLPAPAILRAATTAGLAAGVKEKLKEGLKEGRKKE